MSDYIICQICGKKLKNIGSHFIVHGFTYNEYKEKFPKAKLYNDISMREFSEHGRRGNLGKVKGPMSEETKKKISENNKGKHSGKRTKEQKERMNIAQKKRREIEKKNSPKKITKKRNRILTKKEIESLRLATIQRWKDGKMKNTHSPIANKRRSDSLKKYWETHDNPQKGVKRSEEVKRNMKKGHRRSLQGLKGEERRKNHSRAKIKYWAELTPQDKLTHLSKIRVSTGNRPNKQELELWDYIKDYGFEYNDSTFFVICPVTNKMYIPDYVHGRYTNLLIEFDGFAGHNPKHPWVEDDQPEKDQIRNKVYLDQGFNVLCIPWQEFKGREHIQALVESWLLEVWG